MPSFTTSTTTQAQIDKAVQLLKDGDVVAFPTETVYGLGARIDSDAAIVKIFTTKQRPYFDPLIVHVSSVEQAKSCTTNFSPMAVALANAFWPGPLTLVLPRSEKISERITSGLPDVGLRFPSHAIAQEIISKVGVPIAAPSANKFGRTSPTQASHVKHEFGSEVFIVESQASEIGIESTVLAVHTKDNLSYQISILRKGFITQSQIDAALKNQSTTYQLTYQWIETSKAASPGNMKHHYMPDMPFIICRNQNMKLSELTQILNERLPQLPDQVDGVTIIKPKGAVNKIEFFKLPTDPILAARDLYALLRAASLRAPQALCFIQLPHQTGEMWESIFDRLYKAASLILD